nr:hypothetical protein Iba_chr01dCG5270 [Ipomoea batatas]
MVVPTRQTIIVLQGDEKTERDDEAEPPVTKVGVVVRYDGWQMDFRSGYLKAQTNLEVGVYFSDLAMIGFDWWRRCLARNVRWRSRMQILVSSSLIKRRETERDDEAEHRLPRLEVAGRRWNMAMDFRSGLPQSSNRVTNFISGMLEFVSHEWLVRSTIDGDGILDLEVGV